MFKLLLFAGTYEGRCLAEFCVAERLAVEVCVATAYGEERLAGLQGVTIHMGRLDQVGMEHLLQSGGYDLVVDATHPYALRVTEELQAACGTQQVPYRRLRREDVEIPEGVHWVATVRQAVKQINTLEGNVLLTTGSKELLHYQGITHCEARVYARVLPTEEALMACRKLGLTGRHVVAMQGPFSAAFNQALLEELDCRILVTKCTGLPGGFVEKLDAARHAGVTVLVLEPPLQIAGSTLLEICEELKHHA